MTAMHQFQSAGWRDRIVLLFTPPPFDSDVRRFQQTRGNKPYGEWHETIWAHKAPGTPGVKGIRRYPMEASCSWRPCQVTFSSGPPTTLSRFYILIFGAWAASSSEKCPLFLYRTFKGSYLTTLHPPSDGFLKFFLSCVKRPAFPKTELGIGSGARFEVTLS